MFSGAKKENSKVGNRGLLRSKETQVIMILIMMINDNIQLSPEGEVISGGYIPRREAPRYVSTALHRP